ncbi:DNA-directed RNA polymerases I and III subunit RPAC1-like [Halichondria panicea]|uniref:DNA-directed RNA polymerases I and III subunit RPAC1-like n=1 Tax=Halichondria panicea TaxID=6063 RepID=UPI00312B5BE9
MMMEVDPPVSASAEAVQRIRTRIELGEHSIINTHSSDFPSNYPGFDDAWNIKKFKKGFRVDVVSLSDEEMEFDMIGVDPAVANAFRRILIAEVPTMAIEKVYIINNTSLIQDNVLAHRFGLIPLKVDPRLFKMPPPLEEGAPLPGVPSPDQIVEFNLKVKCKRNPKAPKDSEDPNELYINSKVLSADMKWVPLGDQASRLEDVRPVLDDIVIAKLRPGQEVDVRLLCVKGIGQDHAKFSPVATASYRLLPEIILTQPVTGANAKKLAKCFAKGVIKVVTREDGKSCAEVVDPRKDTCSREVLRHEELKDCVRLSRVRDHFIFSVESSGALPPDTLMVEAIKVLREKCTHFLEELNELTGQ